MFAGTTPSRIPIWRVTSWTSTFRLISTEPFGAPPAASHSDGELAVTTSTHRCAHVNTRARAPDHSNTMSNQSGIAGTNAAKMLSITNGTCSFELAHGACLGHVACTAKPN